MASGNNGSEKRSESTRDKLEDKKTWCCDMIRTAIDRSGSLGSLYNANRDTIQGRLFLEFKSFPYESNNPSKCYIIKGRSPESENLLNMIKIRSESRLSIYLKMIPSDGVASVIDYPLKIDEHTRFICFRYESFRETLANWSPEALTPSSFGTSATHLVTELRYGVVAVVVLQLPADHQRSDTVTLDKICQSLINDPCPMTMSEEEERFCENITFTTVYSNIHCLARRNKFQDVCEEIFQWKRNRSEHQRLEYGLTSISTFYPQHSPGAYVRLNSTIAEDLEAQLVRQITELRKLNVRLNVELPNTLDAELVSQLEPLRRRFSEIQQLRDKRLQRIREWVIKIRKNESIDKSNEELINNCSSLADESSGETLMISLTKLESKNDFIARLKRDGLQYCNVAHLQIRKAYDLTLIQHILRKNYPGKTIICATDNIRDKDKQTKEMVDSVGTGVYTDFTYADYKLEEVLTIKPTGNTTHSNESNVRSGEMSTQLKTPSPASDDCINILLLGESGVGKSTFINAFANYLRFQSLDDAQQGRPVVIIPVSFLLTINDNFDEKVIEFGKEDPNENHNAAGQSVTQQCKSYVFNISNEKKLRLIDTPGFGDTRGDRQDDLNMEQIFAFLKHVPYLNGVCLLFKPEVLRLSPYFQSCCNQLFNYFGKDIRNHLIFCFTNTRSTFFAPGNTRTLLDTFFQSFPVKSIPFVKSNTFCFDSESFRYLVALQHSVSFARNDRREFEQSWLRSVTESKRFRDYLLRQSPYRRNNEWKSVQDAQSQITDAIRPMLEGLRHILRNKILHKLESFIELQATPLRRTQVICYKCSRTPTECGPLLILPDILHNSTSECPAKTRSLTDYTLKYQPDHTSGKNSVVDFKNQLSTLCSVCVQFGYFLMKTSSSTRKDPFQTGLERMIKEETSNCQTTNGNETNKLLNDELIKLSDNYGKQLKVIILDDDRIDLCHIYCLIKSLNELPLVKIQLDAARQCHQSLFRKNERLIATDDRK